MEEGAYTYVPYSGAINNVDLGAYDLTATDVTATNFIIGANTLDTNEWAFMDGLDQALKTTDSPTFAGTFSSGVNL